MGLSISQRVLKKLSAKVPPVSPGEINQCFLNRTGNFLEDTREDHKTDPPTKWFVSRTNQHRALKVVFMRVGSQVIIKTAYDPNSDEMRIYQKYAY